MVTVIILRTLDNMTAVVMLSLHEVRGENVLWAGRVCLSVCPHDLTGKPLDGFG
jgi:hypothetical protein